MSAVSSEISVRCRTQSHGIKRADEWFPSGLLSIALKYGCRTVGLYEQHIVGLGAVALHTRRACGHAGYRQSLSLRALSEQAFDLASRHVTLDGIAAHHRGMASANRVGNAVAAADDARVLHMDRLHPEAVGAQMLDPRAAAASGGVEIDIDIRWLRGENRSRCDCGGERRDESPSVRHVVTSC